MRKRFPDKNSILSVYAVIVFIVYTWTFITFFLKFPSWIFFLTFGEIAGVFAYTMISALFESLFWIGLLLLAAFVLPQHLLRDDFLTRAGWFILVFLALLVIYLVPDMQVRDKLVVAPWLSIITTFAALIAWLSSRIRFMGKFMRFFSDRLLVLPIIYVPISIISLVVVVVRLPFMG